MAATAAELDCFGGKASRGRTATAPAGVRAERGGAGVRRFGTGSADGRQGQRTRRRVAAGRARLRKFELRHWMALTERATTVTVVVIGGHASLDVRIVGVILALLGTRGPDSQAACGGQMGAAATFSKQGQRLMGKVRAGFGADPGHRPAARARHRRSRRGQCRGGRDTAPDSRHRMAALALLDARQPDSGRGVRATARSQPKSLPDGAAPVGLILVASASASPRQGRRALCP